MKRETGESGILLWIFAPVFIKESRYIALAGISHNKSILIVTQFRQWSTPGGQRLQTCGRGQSVPCSRGREWLQQPLHLLAGPHLSHLLTCMFVKQFHSDKFQNIVDNYLIHILSLASHNFFNPTTRLPFWATTSRTRWTWATWVATATPPSTSSRCPATTLAR